MTAYKSLLSITALITSLSAWADKEPQPPTEQVLPKIQAVATTEDDIGYIASRSSAGTKTDTPLFDIPQSITVVTEEQIAAQGTQSVAQSLRYVGGVIAEPRGVMTALDYFYARGFLLNQFVDGLKTLSGGYSLPQPDPYLLERVEVLRGPASVLYGQAEPGGVLNLVSKRPTETTLRTVELEVGSFGRVQGAVDLSGALGTTDEVSGRLTALVRDADSQVDHAEEQRIAIAPALTWKPSDNTSLTILSNYQNDPHVGYYNWITAYGTVLPNPYRPDQKLPTSFDTGDPGFDKYTRQTYSIGDYLEHRFNDTWTLRQNLRFSHVQSEFDKVYSSYLDADFHTLNRYAWHLRDDLSAITSDNQLQTLFDTGEFSHTVLFGIDYQHNRYHQLLGYNFDSGTDPGQVPPLDIYNPIYGLPIDVPDFSSDAIQTQYQIGIYAQDQIKFGKLNLLLGGREDHSHNRTVQRLYDSADAQSDHAFTKRAGAVYVFESGFAPYLSYTESFTPTSGTAFDGNPFKPTTGTQQEVGVKYQAPNSNGFAMVSAYNLKQQNVLSNDVLHPGESVQTGEIRSRGFELSGGLNLVGSLDLIASFGHVDQEVTKGGVSFGPAVGKTPAAIAADTGSIWVDYAIHNNCLAGLGFGGGVRYVGSSWGDDGNTFKVPNYTLVDAMLHYDFPAQSALAGWALKLNISNLFDKVYVASCGGTDYCGYGLRRTITGTISRHW